MGAVAGVPAANVGFFNFQFPNATKWLLIIDNDSFEMTIPSEFLVFERSYSYFVTGATVNFCCFYLKIDGVNVTGRGGGTWYESISPTVLNPDVAHQVDPESDSRTSVAISLLYLPPP